MTVACHFSQLNIEFNQTNLFPPLSGTFVRQKNALIGHNGRGKSVLMRLLAGLLSPTSGSIDWMMPFIHVDQLTRLQGLSIADALGISILVQAFERVDSGNAAMDDFELLEDKWHLPATWERLLDSAKLPVSIETPIESLSGGQRTRLALCRAFLHKDHFLLLDEPDNHLDHEGQQWLTDKLAQHHSGSLIITHNRALLSQMQMIFELTDKGLHEYGGNYSLYEEQKNFAMASIEAQAERLDNELRQEKRQQQVTLQKAEKRRKQGEKVRYSGSQSLLLLDMKTNRAQKRQSNIAERHQRVMNDIQAQRQATQDKQIHTKQQKMALNYQPEGCKITIFASQLRLPYGHSLPLSFTAYTGEHWHIKGRNGCGKSTLLKILAGEIQAVSGEYRISSTFCYLDQHLNLLDKTLPVAEALQRYQPAFTVEQWRTQLGMLRIRGDKSLQSLNQLSGGEQLKATLLALTHSPNPPAILLLDEPDNHLDLDSKALLEELLKGYQGTLFLVSHDETFVEHCQITHELKLSSI
ncbi:ATP-binding cassette domain-containing protein [Providencia burhodogranariea]|uniref:ABC transporter ATP-binding protein n=1 Tax=Providencia burhodogranariea DSM 19968 TaxID=1141662 RepID=K8WB97_9GAMM|nr:ATP-binding cassette domain-containing protein [Providencia burhodogranariea]EKT57196.1 ABC transporter ATP-binding protein [Providencia burhodogranariea DSM 19968]